MKSNNVLILAVTTTLPLAALADSTGRPNGVAKHTGTYADVSVGGKVYNVQVDNFFDDIRYGELPTVVGLLSINPRGREQSVVAFR